MPAQPVLDGGGEATRRVRTRLPDRRPESEALQITVQGPARRPLRAVADLASASRRAHRVTPSFLRERPCKGPAILYCLVHRELFDVWTFWNPEAFGEISGDVVAALERYLAEREPDRGPAGASRDARVLDLVAAFLERHDGCRVRSCDDGSREYAEAIGSGEEAWTVFCQSEDDPLWERVSLAQLERCRREVERFAHYRPEHVATWEERVEWHQERDMWVRHLRALEKKLKTTGRLWPDHVPFGDVLEQLRSTPLEPRLVVALA